jgi:hypothetical protein
MHISRSDTGELLVAFKKPGMNSLCFWHRDEMPLLGAQKRNNL